MPYLLQGQVFLEKIPKGECTGCIIETEISKDTIWVVDKYHSGENQFITIFTKADVLLSNDSVFLSKDLHSKDYHYNLGLFYKGKWLMPSIGYLNNHVWQEDSTASQKAFAKSSKAIYKWQLAIIKEKYPDYYAKYLKGKKP